jgi:hypothetical protein
MQLSTTKLRLSDACRQLGIPYQRLFLAVTSGTVPAERNETGSRWVIKKSDLPDIAKTLGVDAPHVSKAA